MKEDEDKVMKEIMNEVERERETIIGADTRIKIGLVAGGLGIFLAAFWWWAAWTTSVNNKLDQINAALTTMQANDKLRQNDISEMNRRFLTDYNELNKRLLVIETAGSPSLKDLNKELNEIRHMLEGHISGKP